MNQYMAKIHFEEEFAELRKISRVSGQGVFVYGSIEGKSPRGISWLSNNPVFSQFFDLAKDYDEIGYMYNLEERFKLDDEGDEIFPKFYQDFDSSTDFPLLSSNPVWSNF